MFVHRFARSAFAVLLLALQATFGQGSGWPSLRSRSSHQMHARQRRGLVLGFVGAGILAAYLGYRLDHPRLEASIVGCTAQGDGTMTLVEDNTQILYSLTTVPKKVRAGERVTLRGKKKFDTSGKNLFQARKLVKDEGPCEPPSPTAPQENAP